MNLVDDIKEFLNKKLLLDVYLDKTGINKFYMVIEKYLKNRSSMETFFNNVNSTVDFLEKIGLSSKEIIICISNWPSIIHSDKNDLLYKYLVIAKPSIYNKDEFDRRDIIVNHPKDLMTSLDTIFARIEYFLSSSYNDISRTSGISRRKLFKITNSEFFDSYNVNKEDLLARYPLTKDKLLEVFGYECNKEIVGRFYGDSKDFGKRSS